MINAHEIQAMQKVAHAVNAAAGMPLTAPMSRRKLLWRASVLSLTLPGLGMALTACDRDPSHKDKDKQEGSNHEAAEHAAAMQHADGASAMSVVTPEMIAAAASAKLATYDPVLPPLPAGDTLRLHWRSQETALRVSPNVAVAAWTFENNVPGPIAHCRVGDTVEFTLTNDTFMPHSMDFHAAQINPTKAFRSVSKGQSVSYSFKPRHAGAFLYHCGTAPMLLHIGAGMFGAIVVSPREPLPPAREFVLVQNEYYLGQPTGGVYPLDFAKMLSVAPDLMAFNGRPDQYMRAPIRVKVGDRVRFWVVNAGPSLPCAFHVVGAQFDTVYLGEPPTSAIHGVQTFEVAAGGGMGFELTCDQPGEFPFVNHACGHGQKGAMGTLIVEP
jgi:nitrite reductase (NO-forming)